MYRLDRGPLLAARRAKEAEGAPTRPDSHKDEEETLRHVFPRHCRDKEWEVVGIDGVWLEEDGSLRCKLLGHQPRRRSAASRGRSSSEPWNWSRGISALMHGTSGLSRGRPADVAAAKSSWLIEMPDTAW